MPQTFTHLFHLSQGFVYPSNGYVQTTGLQFDPNYGRNGTAYASPIQRYEFQAQQITPINQVSLQSVNFAPQVTYAGQISGPTTVLLNHHQQHHPHYATHQQHNDQLNKQMASGNDLPGYLRVNSAPPRSLSCNGYPGAEYGGNTINTTANSNALTNTSSSQSTTSVNGGTTNNMQPPHVPQSPNRQQQPPRPNSNQMYPQQSPNHYSNSNNNIHMSPNASQSPSHHQNGSTTPNNQHYPATGMNTPTSHHQQENPHMNNQEWATWNSQAQANDMYNQSDRINLNTRLKTMILNKSDKEQQNQQTGHFLSYSHQHLHEQQHLNSNNNVNSSNSNASGPVAEAGSEGDGGGFPSNNNKSAPGDQWKSSMIKLENDPQQKSKDLETDFFEQKQQINEKNIGDPGGGSEEKIPFSMNETNEKDVKQTLPIDSNNSSINSFNSTSNVSNHNTYPPESLAGFPSSKFNEKPLSNDTGKATNYYSANDYQQHQNMVNNIKKEPNEDSTGQPSVKTEGYEKNYQNFIRYADFCDAQQQQQFTGQDQKQPLSQYQQEYMQHQQGYYNNYAYQNYPHHPQNYPASHPHQQNYQQFLGQQSYHQQPGMLPHSASSVGSLTNFEQQIPLHTYPIPKHPKGDILQPSAIKSEHPMACPQHPYPYMGDGGPASIKDPVGYSCCRQGSTANPTNEHLKDGSCGGLQSKGEVIKEEPEDESDSKPVDKPIPPSSNNQKSSAKSKQPPTKDPLNERNNKPEVPECDCFPSDKNPPEPGSYYTHLGN